MWPLTKSQLHFLVWWNRGSEIAIRNFSRISSPTRNAITSVSDGVSRPLQSPSRVSHHFRTPSVSDKLHFQFAITKRFHQFFWIPIWKHVSLPKNEPHYERLRETVSKATANANHPIPLRSIGLTPVLSVECYPYYKEHLLPGEEKIK